MTIILNSAVESTLSHYCTESSSNFCHFLTHRMGDTLSPKNDKNFLNLHHISGSRNDSTAEFRIISVIAIIDEQRGLGKNNRLLCHLPADLQHFKTITFGKPVIMGRKTFDSIGKPLPGRWNIVLSQHATDIEGVTICHSLPKALALTKEYPEVMIIGGARVFQEALPLAHRAYITVMHATCDADVFFPPLKPTDWSCCSAIKRPKDEKNPYDLTFYQYEKTKKLKLQRFTART